jgi:hypothetical protein|tara:strand:+ start:356 stop:535 length:180 start_codon:yes stop_codon:yes gene_type:complete
MFINPEAKEWIQMLDNSKSYIHQEAFRTLKDTLIRNLTSTYHVDSFGEVWFQENELGEC